MDNLCLYCGELIPEGRMVCPICEDRLLYDDYYDEAGITKGCGNGTFRPDKPITRGEMATVPHRCDMVHFSQDKAVKL